MVKLEWIENKVTEGNKIRSAQGELRIVLKFKVFKGSAFGLIL